MFSAIGFTAVGIRDGDGVVIGASLLFLAGCVVFIADLFGAGDR